MSLSASQRETCQHFAQVNAEHFRKRLSSGGGKSHIHDAKKRAATLADDAIVGQYCEAAGHLFLWRTFQEYSARRRRMLTNLSTGDDSDIDGLNVDIKGSQARYGQSKRALLKDYHLPVRPRERKRGRIYLRLLVTNDDRIHFIGWAPESMLPDKVEPAGPLSGAYVLRNASLYPWILLPGTLFDVIQRPSLSQVRKGR